MQPSVTFSIIAYQPGNFSQEEKFANISSIFEGGVRILPSNYHPNKLMSVMVNFQKDCWIDCSIRLRIERPVSKTAASFQTKLVLFVKRADYLRVLGAALSSVAPTNVAYVELSKAFDFCQPIMSHRVLQLFACSYGPSGLR